MFVFMQGDSFETAKHFSGSYQDVNEIILNQQHTEPK